MQNMNPIKLSNAEMGNLRVAGYVKKDDPHLLRLCQMGLIKGAKIKLIKKGHSGSPFIVSFNQTILCLDEMLASKFLVDAHKKARKENMV